MFCLTRNRILTVAINNCFLSLFVLFAYIIVTVLLFLHCILQLCLIKYFIVWIFTKKTFKFFYWPSFLLHYLLLFLIKKIFFDFQGQLTSFMDKTSFKSINLPIITILIVFLFMSQIMGHFIHNNPNPIDRIWWCEHGCFLLILTPTPSPSPSNK